MVDLCHPNTSIITTKVDQLITVTTQAGVTTQDRKISLRIALSPDGPQELQLGSIERLVGQLGNGVGNNL